MTAQDMHAIWAIAVMICALSVAVLGAKAMGWWPR